MPKPKPADVDSYLADQPAKVRAALVKVRAALRRALPGSVEAIKYGMPAYLVAGRAVASFAGWKAQYALYIVSPALFEEIAKDLVGHDASKGIIRFGLDEAVPEWVFERLAAGVADAARAAPKVQKPRKDAQKKSATKKPVAKKPVAKKPAQKKPARRRP